MLPAPSCAAENIALHKEAFSCPWEAGSRVFETTDGDKSSHFIIFCYGRSSSYSTPMIAVDLGAVYNIGRIVIWGTEWNYLDTWELRVGFQRITAWEYIEENTLVWSQAQPPTDDSPFIISFNPPVTGRWIMLQAVNRECIKNVIPCSYS